MPERLDADLALDIESSKRAIEELRSEVETQLSAAAESFASALADAVQGVPPIEATVDAAPITEGITEAVGAADGVEFTPEAAVDAIPTDVEGAVDAADPAPVGVDADPSAIPGEVEAAIGAADGTQVAVDADASGMAAEIEAAVAAVDPEAVQLDVEADTSAASAAVSDLGASAHGSGSEIRGLEGAVTGFEAAAGAATGSGRGLGEVLSSSGGAAAAGVAAFVASGEVVRHFANEAIYASGVTDQFNNSLGEAADRVENMSDIEGLDYSLGKLALTLGGDDDALRQVTARLFQLATSSGVSSSASAQYVEQLAALGARAVALNPALGTVDEVVNRLSTGLTRGGRFAAQYGISISQAEIAQRAMADTGKTATTELTFVDKAMAGAAIASERYGGNLNEIVAKGSENAIIKQRTLTQAFKEAEERLGAPLVVPLFDLMEAAEPLVLSIGQLFSTLGVAILPLVTAAVRGLVPVFGSVAAVLQVLTPPLQALAEILNALPAPVLTAGLALLALPRILGLVSNGMFALSNVAPLMGEGIAQGAAGVASGGAAVSGFGEAITAVLGPAALLAIVAGGALYALGAFGTIQSGVNVALAESTTHHKELSGELAKFAEMERNVTAQIEEHRKGQANLTREQVVNQSASSGLVSAYALLGAKQDKLVEQVRALAKENPEAARSFLDVARDAGVSAGEMDRLTGAVDRGTKAYDRKVKATAEHQIASSQFQADVSAETSALGGVPASADAAKQAYDTLIQTLVAGVQTAIPTFGQMTDTFVKNFQSAFGDKLTPSVEDFIGELMRQTADYGAWLDTIQDLTNRGLFGLANLVQTQGPKIGAALGYEIGLTAPDTLAAWDQHLQALRIKGVEMNNEATTLGQAQAQHYAIQIAAMSGFTTKTLGDVQAQWTGATPTLTEVANVLGAAAVGGYGVGIAPITPTTAAAMDQAQGAIAGSGVPGQAGATGAAASGQYGGGIAGIGPETFGALGIAAGIMDQGATIVGSPARIAGLSVGGQFGEGIRDGINQWVRAISDAAAEAVNSAERAAKNAQDGHSPSRVMMEVGADWSAGYAIGIGSGAGDVVAAAEQIARDAASLRQPFPMPPERAQPPVNVMVAAGGPPGRGGNTYNITTLPMSPDAVAREIQWREQFGG